MTHEEEARHNQVPQSGFPLTNLIVELMRMTHRQRQQVKLGAIAAKHGLTVGQAQPYVNHYKGVWEDDGKHKATNRG